MADFLEMPGMLPTEDLAKVRLRDVHTGRFVASPSLVYKKLSVSSLFEGITAGSIGGVIANQVPQNRRSSKKALKRLDPNLSVGLKKKSKE
jgi:hypothetical protein